ncbi:hypothetical protein L3X38_003587 [Prunus dulcis]|uniref:DUF4218 domain-containing protein n=1 Tax=Prunus dulcis TaxID=3755 RepID=A0AAD4ZMC5_PRUDU|nr:hypothetical protein L3X38_003587 [Prunus dulcis]
MENSQGTHVFKPAERRAFCEFLKSVKFPNGYASNISRNVNVDEGTVSGLKSHDCHVLMQRLLLGGIRKDLKKSIYSPLVELSSFFQQICAKTLRVVDLDKLEENIVMTLCKLEKIFPPAFFDVMVHLAVHLPQEAKLGGPVGYRWMYPIEKLLGTYKKYVRNKARPKGSIVEAYIPYESLTFCSMYLSNVETTFSRAERNDDGGEPDAKLSVFAQKVCTFGAQVMVEMSSQEKEASYWYILDNCDEIESFRNEHYQILERETLDNLAERHRKLFPNWFRARVAYLYSQGSELVDEELYSLAQGPDSRCVQYTGSMANGWYKDDPYVLPTQARQVFYVDDPKLGLGWKVVHRFEHRHLWDIPEKVDIDINDGYEEIELGNNDNDDADVEDCDDDGSGSSLYRHDEEPETIVVDNISLERIIPSTTDFIDDDIEEDEILSREEEDSVHSDRYSDLD